MDAPDRLLRPKAVLLDLDGVLYVEDAPIPGAIEAVAALRDRGLRLRFVTNTTSRPRRDILARLERLRMPVRDAELVTPARLAVEHCVAAGRRRALLLMRDDVKADLAGVEEVGDGADVVVVGDLGEAFGYRVLNHAFRELLAGAELVALQKNRYWRTPDGLSLDVGPFVAALEYAAGRAAVVVGKPAPAFFATVLAGLDVPPGDAVMVGDDVESDIGGAVRAGLAGVLVRTGKFRPEAVAASGVEPTATVASIADVPELLGGVSAVRALPDGFAVGHWTDAEAATGCTVVLPPEDGAVASGEVRGGGPGTRDTDRLSPLVSATHVHAVLLTGGSAFGLAAADGVTRWLEERGRGHWTPAGRLPLVPSAVIYDLLTGDPSRRPGPDDGYAACEAASPAVALGCVGAGTGAAVGKLFGRDRAVKAGVGLAAQELPQGPGMAALAVVNAFGDVLGEDGGVLAGARGENGAFVHTTAVIRAHGLDLPREELTDSTTLVCLVTDATLTKAECAIVAKMAHAGMARAVDPVHSAFDGDVVFVLASGTAAPVDASVAGVVAAGLTAEAIRDGCRRATGLGGIPALTDPCRS